MIKFDDKVVKEYNDEFSRVIRELMFEEFANQKFPDGIFKLGRNFRSSIYLREIYYDNEVIVGDKEFIGDYMSASCVEDFTIEGILNTYNTIIDRVSYESCNLVPLLEFGMASEKSKDISKLLYELYNANNPIKYYKKVGVEVKLIKELKIKLDGKVYCNREYLFYNKTVKDFIDKKHNVKCINSKCTFTKCKRNIPYYLDSHYKERDINYVYIKGYFLDNVLVKDKGVLKKLGTKFSFWNSAVNGIFNKSEEV